MTLTVDQVYKIANKLLEDDYVLELYEKVKNQKSLFCAETSLNDISLIVFQQAGLNCSSLFEKNDRDDLITLVVKNGRIYYSIFNFWDMRIEKPKPITNKILSRFKLTDRGKEFVKKYLE